MNTLLSRITAVAIGAGAIAAGALATSGLAHAATFDQLCVLSPENYADGAVRGVFSTQKQGFDLAQICRLYDSKDYLIHTETELIRGYYRFARPVPPAQLASR
jgi:hypothetical protein